MNAISVATGNFLLLVLLLMGVYLYVRAGNSVRARVAERARSRAAQPVHTAAVANERSAKTLREHIGRAGRALAHIGERLPIFDAKQRAALALACQRAGFYGPRAVSALVGIKFTCGIGASIDMLAFGSRVPVFGQYLLLRAMLMLAAFIVGMIVPEYALAFRARRRRRQIAAVLPDALDLLVICTNAGHSLAVGIHRVAKEIRMVSAPLANELEITASELHLGGDASFALRNLGERIDLPSVRSLVSTLIQSQQYGTPITTALKTLSKSSRTQAILELEEKAAKLAPKMTLPMMIFILPTVAIIAAGPAVMRLMTVFGK
ncbi:MAG TPA: type II secretion system F family protein [Paraburkholderia sp.]|jgi:tight adherence protein C|nr:type II secretion system F family protein [Paraburkholderia sp.]